MSKLKIMMLPILLASSCSPLEINVATNNATLADKVYSYLNNYWYSDIFYKDVELKDAAVAQFVYAISNLDVSRGLDPYTYIIKNTPTVEDTNGKIGITSSVTFNYPVISKVNEGSVAEGSLQVGDIIYGLGKEDEKGNVVYKYISDPLYNVTSLLNYASGPVGNKVYYKIFRYEDNKFKDYDFEFTLATPMESKSAYEVKTDIDDTLMVKFTTFDAKLSSYFEEILKKNEENDTKKHNLIIDLRDNGGGKVQAAINCCDLLLDANKKVLSIQDKYSNITEYTTGTKLGDYSFDKYIILVNENTASSSEILLKCLDYYMKDNLTIIGNKTFGKGLVTNTVNLDSENKYSLQYLAGKWLDPKDEYMEYKTGIEPDYIIDKKNYLTLMDSYYNSIDYSNNIRFDTVSNVNTLIANVLNAKYDYQIRNDGYYDTTYTNYIKQYQELKDIDDVSGVVDEETYLNLVYDYYLARVEFEDNHMNKVKDIING